MTNNNVEEKKSGGHTPGPWRIRGKRDGLICIESGATAPPGYGLPVANGLCCPWMVKESEANARIISAAPDLLAACKAAFAYYESENLAGPSWCLLRSAIAKAEGRE